VRYELMWPFFERSGQMVNLDVAPGFSAASPVISGDNGPYTGAFPKALLNADTNNVAPRIGFAWRIKPGNILRGGYGISYNSGSYASIARQLGSQPPFAVTNNSIGTFLTPLTFADPFATASPTETTNNYGVAKDYALGLVQTINADFSKELRQVWSLGAGYTETRGSSLDIIRAPNRGPAGLRIQGVQPFLWQTSEGSSVLHAATFRASRRPVKGIGGGVSYTLAKSRDNASSIGGGGSTVAQDDQNLAAEWGLSSFDRRHQLSANTSIELPFGPNRRWLTQPGPGQSLLRDWRFTTTFTWQSGTPYTPRVTGAVSDVARGTNGTLRADYTGAGITLANPTIDRFFNTSAFTVPALGTFGNAYRNMIIGPGSRQLNAQFARDVRLGGTRVMSVQMNANNLLNLVNYGAIDTVVNSPTFGQILSVRGMRSMQLNLRFRF
jgi:trimeric autotransporter adhesin